MRHYRSDDEDSARWRILKTHKPLDGVPLVDRVHYVVVGRHPSPTPGSGGHDPT